MNLTVAFWNRWRLGNAARQSEYLANGQVEWDVLLLAEMTPRAFETICHRLEPTSAAFALHMVNANDMKQPHGVAIITRLGRSLSNVRLLPADDSDPETAPRPERFIAATVNSTSSAASMNRFMDSPGATLERTLLNSVRNSAGILVSHSS